MWLKRHYSYNPPLPSDADTNYTDITLGKIFIFFRLHCSPIMMIKLWLNVVCLLRHDWLIVISEPQETAEQG